MIKKILKILVQIAIIYLIYTAGNYISSAIKNYILIPGNIIGMVILLILLSTNALKLSAIEETGSFMLKYMGFFFVPLTVGLMNSYSLIADSILQIVVILFVSCILVMFVSSKVTDMLISYRERNKSNG